MKKLNFGCGDEIWKDWDNVDIQKNPKLTKSFDFNIFPYPIKENTYDHIFTSQVLEHLQEPDKVLLELHRICKPDALIRIQVPYYNNKGASGNMQHLHYFSDETFRDFVEERKVIDKKQKFEIVRIILTPTIAGKFMPKKLREKLSLFLGGLISKVDAELRVKK